MSGQRRCEICSRPLYAIHAVKSGTCSACTPAPPDKYSEKSLALKQPLVRHGLIYRQKKAS